VEKRRKRDFELLQVACFAEAGQLRHDVRDQAVVKKRGVRVLKPRVNGRPFLCLRLFLRAKC
jgi:hypothetical protein